MTELIDVLKESVKPQKTVMKIAAITPIYIEKQLTTNCNLKYSVRPHYYCVAHSYLFIKVEKGLTKMILESLQKTRRSILALMSRSQSSWQGDQKGWYGNT